MDRIALILAIIGGLNWGSIGLFRFDIVAWLFGGQTATVSLSLIHISAFRSLPILSCPSSICPPKTNLKPLKNF